MKPSFHTDLLLARSWVSQPSEQGEKKNACCLTHWICDIPVQQSTVTTTCSLMVPKFIKKMNHFKSFEMQ